MKIIKLTDNIIKKKTYFNSRLFIAADFETIQLNGIHYVYAIGYKYAIDSSEISDDMYINIDTENIKLDSNVLIKKFIDKLLSINKKKIIITKKEINRNALKDHLLNWKETSIIDLETNQIYDQLDESNSIKDDLISFVENDILD